MTAGFMGQEQRPRFCSVKKSKIHEHTNKNKMK